MYQLDTPKLRKALSQLPRLYETDGQNVKAYAHVKLFTPWSNWTWYVIEFDGDDVMYTFCVGFEAEFGYSSLKELNSVRSPLGLPVEQDLYFEPAAIREIILKEHIPYYYDGFEDMTK